MEHTLNRQTTTILTYINQGRRPAAPSPFPCPSGPAAEPVQPRFPRPVRARRAVRRARPGPERPPVPMGSGASRRGPSSWRPPDSTAYGRTAPPIVASGSPRSGDRDAVQRIRMNMGREGGREGKERMDVRMDTNKGIRVDEDE